QPLAPLVRRLRPLQRLAGLGFEVVQAGDVFLPLGAVGDAGRPQRGLVQGPLAELALPPRGEQALFVRADRRLPQPGEDFQGLGGRRHERIATLLLVGVTGAGGEQKGEERREDLTGLRHDNLPDVWSGGDARRPPEFHPNHAEIGAKADKQIRPGPPPALRAFRPRGGNNRSRNYPPPRGRSGRVVRLCCQVAAWRPTPRPSRAWRTTATTCACSPACSWTRGSRGSSIRPTWCSRRSPRPTRTATSSAAAPPPSRPPGCGASSPTTSSTPPASTSANSPSSSPWS